ncbi:MAG: NAD(+)/NADH kinase [Candidatus Thermoplasmatota archaeon]|nr:NAD(+)/NADH kinase [Candidatus Thermoplasmatota archaeon]
MKKRIGFASKPDENSIQIACETAKYVSGKYGQGVQISAEGKIAKTLGIRPKKLQDMEVDLIVCVGGDGTTMRCLRSNKAPVFGINTSIVGFLTSVDPKDAKTAIEQIIDGKFHVEERMKISTSFGKKKLPDAVNDVVVKSSMDCNVIGMRVFLDGKLVEDVRGDGIIIATPSGSTAYAMSAGGPIVDPRIDALLIVPIAPFRFGSRPLIVPASSKIEIEVASRSGHLVIDGQFACDLPEGSKISCKRSDEKARFARVKDDVHEFYRKISEKLR